MIKEVSYSDIVDIRHSVMYPDKDKEIVLLADDELGIHLGYHKNDKPVSIVSIFLKNGELQFRKLATLPEFHNQGFATMLVKWILDYAKDMQFSRVWCNSRVNKISFYEKLGFVRTGDTFEKDGYTFEVLEKLF